MIPEIKCIAKIVVQDTTFNFTFHDLHCWRSIQFIKKLKLKIKSKNKDKLYPNVNAASHNLCFSAKNAAWIYAKKVFKITSIRNLSFTADLISRNNTVNGNAIASRNEMNTFGEYILRTPK